MVSIQLDLSHEKRLAQLAIHEGRDAADLARKILADYLDLHALPIDSDADWAEVSVSLSAEVINDEPWDIP